MRSDGKTVVITDETMGFGVITYQCEAGVTCPGSTAAPPATTSAATSPGMANVRYGKQQLNLSYL